MTYTILILFNATAHFMGKDRSVRDEIVKNEIRPLITHFGEKININMFDCDFTHSKYSDFMIATTDNLEDFGYFMGYMRESQVLAAPYFEIKELVIGVPQNFRGSINMRDLKIGS